MRRSTLFTNLLLCCCVCGPGAWAASGEVPSPPAAQVPTVPAAKKPPATKPQVVRPAKHAAPPAGERYRPTRFSRRAELHYGLVWGVDSLSVRWVESGEVIRFSYRVLDAARAQALNNKKSEPSLIDLRAGVSLVVPAMENVGQLRQSADAEEGKSYWMAFSNKGRLVKRGDRVNVVIGQFRADGLVVD
jgi:hypothetical protein